MLKHVEFKSRQAFTQEELLAFAYGRLIEDPPEGFRARLPVPPMLMVDRIDEISGDKSRGRISASRDVRLDDWFFHCHFLGDPVQPGCLGLDGVWQLLGFYCNWRGGVGAGRALGCGEVEFFGQIRPHDGIMRYEITIKRYTELKNAGAAMVIGDGSVLIDDEEIYTIKGARVGLFQGIDYPDYPFESENARGGRMER
jgi:3-hydroxyacyl-[acyl-carrier protein] dehydratase/trans-2-decenoyl-[acyl-carrier protein] isomerase